MNDKYQTFIQYLFDREESSADWRFELDLEEPDLSAEEKVELVKRMLESYQQDLAGYSNWQLGMGLEYIFNNSFSDLVFCLREGPVSLDKRSAAIRALKGIFGECLNHRCEKTLGHLSEEGNQLNHFCYMLWDTTPLTYCQGIDNGDEIYAAVADVMQFSLSLDNIACIESGLHGLGHIGIYYPPAAQIVRQFLQTTKQTDQRLLAYAGNAESGCAADAILAKSLSARTDRCSPWIN